MSYLPDSTDDLIASQLDDPLALLAHLVNLIVSSKNLEATILASQISLWLTLRHRREEEHKERYEGKSIY